jgi:hypothetical protein
LAGFQASTHGRIWVSTEGYLPAKKLNKTKEDCKRTIDGDEAIRCDTTDPLADFLAGDCVRPVNHDL